MMELSGIQRISHTVLMITGGRPIDEVMRSLRARNAALRNMIIGANERRSAYERSRPDNEHRSAYVRSRSVYECRPDNERRSVYERRSTAMAEMTAAMVCTVGAKAGFGANSAAPCTHWNRCSQPQARNRSSHGAAAAPIIRGNWQQHLPMGALGLQNESPFSGHVAEGLNDCEGRRRRQAAPGAAAAAAVDAQQHQAASCPPPHHLYQLRRGRDAGSPFADSEEQAGAQKPATAASHCICRPCCECNVCYKCRGN